MKENKPSPVWRSVLTVIMGAMFYFGMLFYTAGMPSVEASVAANQVQDSIAVYAASQAFIHSGHGVGALWAIFLLLLLAVWWKYFAYFLDSSLDEDSKDK